MPKSIESGPSEPEPNQEEEPKEEPRATFQELKSAKMKPRPLSEEERKKIEESLR